ncbi:DUF1707 domain-containing protein [Actinomycetospora sp. CA-053990]|uniref:DUF1707 domain-containing protein n=1 Tax=Actinomycetospora sp. CA-053990 TaxID=3239891 RepID=UPI003D8C1C98
MADVGAHERELAMEALDAHRRAGRLAREEHASRCAAASRAGSRSQLDALFRDLPEPHPAYPSGAPAAPPPPRRARPRPRTCRSWWRRPVPPSPGTQA